MWVGTYLRTRKQARELAEMVASGEASAHAGLMRDARKLYSQAGRYKRRVHSHLSSEIGPGAARYWDRKADHILTPLATLVSAWDR